MPLETSPENPAPLRVINAAIADWVNRLGSVWVEGQITQLTARRGMSQAFIELRDVDQNLSARVVATPNVLSAIGRELSEGDRVIAHVKPQFFPNRGQLVLRADEIRPVGIGDLLARIEHLRQRLHNEGLFSPSRKVAPPFLPRTIGLICGRDSAAQRDVIDNVERRWPSIAFEIRQVAVQGSQAVTEVSTALAELDALEHVDVIVIARGGGSVEDLLAFSDEALIRAVANAATPVVSAIGHEQDAPLLDFVADVRASTPTDAANRIVPSFLTESEFVANHKDRLDRVILARLEQETHRISMYRSHPLLASPIAITNDASDGLSQLQRRSATALLHQLQLATSTTQRHRTALRAYSPAATLERGYAIVTDASGVVVTSQRSVDAGESVHIRLSDGELSATVTETKEGHNGGEVG